VLVAAEGFGLLEGVRGRSGRTGMDVVEMREIPSPANNLTNICQNQ